jgi:hypothetical protein
MTGCKNCGSHFTDDELRVRKPPVHPWPLTAVGQRVMLENATNGGDARPCPQCGCRSLR